MRHLSSDPSWSQRDIGIRNQLGHNFLTPSETNWKKYQQLPDLGDKVIWYQVDTVFPHLDKLRTMGHLIHGQVDLDFSEQQLMDFSPQYSDEDNGQRKFETKSVSNLVYPSMTYLSNGRLQKHRDMQTEQTQRKNVVADYTFPELQQLLDFIRDIGIRNQLGYNFLTPSEILSLIMRPLVRLKTRGHWNFGSS
jgi:hypothetical protein